MVKQTSLLNFDIIQFVMRDQRIQSLISARDHHPLTFGMEILCRYVRANPSDSTLSEYTVDFVYYVTDQRLEIKDDVSVLVSVKQGNPVGFCILNIRTY